MLGNLVARKPRLGALLVRRASQYRYWATLAILILILVGGFLSGSPEVQTQQHPTQTQTRWRALLLIALFSKALMSLHGTARSAASKVCGLLDASVGAVLRRHNTLSSEPSKKTPKRRRRKMSEQRRQQQQSSSEARPTVRTNPRSESCSCRSALSSWRHCLRNLTHAPMHLTAWSVRKSPPQTRQPLHHRSLSLLTWRSALQEKIRALQSARKS